MTSIGPSGRGRPARDVQQLHGRTLGVIGPRHWSRVARLGGIGMNVIAWSFNQRGDMRG